MPVALSPRSLVHIHLLPVMRRPAGLESVGPRWMVPAIENSSENNLDLALIMHKGRQ